MQTFTYERARDERDPAASVSAQPEARFIAGGASPVDPMGSGILPATPPSGGGGLALDRIETAPGGGLRIGAQVRNSDLAAHERLRRCYPVLAAAILAGAPAQLRKQATTAGNLLQRTRCYYFHDAGKACNKREPGSGCAALHGYNRMHAVLGGSGACIAAHPSDMAVALTVLDARIETVRPDGTARSMPITGFYRLPHATPHVETMLEHGEMIVAVVLPPPLPGRQVYRRVQDHAAFELALVSVAAVVEVHEGRLRIGRLALGGVATKPWRCTGAEEVLAGADATPATFARAASVALEGAQGHGHNDFKIELARRTIREVLGEAAKAVSPR